MIKTKDEGVQNLSGRKKDKKSKKNSKVFPIISFGVAASAFFSLVAMRGSAYDVVLTLGVSALAAGLVWLIVRAKRQQAETTAAETTEAPDAPATAEKKSYGSKIDPIIEEGNRALAEMGRLYASIQDREVRQKINEIMRITDKIMQDAIQDPADVPQIKKFMNYYLPTTIKLLNAYDRMGMQGIEGENVDKSMRNINEMLDTAIEAYKKRLDSLLANQALDIETDIAVLNTMLERDGLTGSRDFTADNEQSAQGQARGATM